MAKTTEKYEVLYVLNPNLTEEERNVGAGIAQLRIPRQAAHKNDMIQHIIPSAYS